MEILVSSLLILSNEILKILNDVNINVIKNIKPW